MSACSAAQRVGKSAETDYQRLPKLSIHHFFFITAITTITVIYFIAPASLRSGFPVLILLFDSVLLALLEKIKGVLSCIRFFKMKVEECWFIGRGVALCYILPIFSARTWNFFWASYCRALFEYSVIL